MSQISIVSANLGAIIAQSFLFGAFVLLFAICMYVSVVRPNTHAGQRSGSFNILLLVTSVMLFLLITTGWIIMIVHDVLGFVTYRDNPGTRLYFSIPTIPSNIAQLALYIFQTLIADAIVICRLYIIWNRKPWICIFPALCWLACTGSGMLFVIDLCRTKPTLGAIIELQLLKAKIRKPILIGASATLLLNVFSTAMISIRVWVISGRAKNSAQLRSKFSRPIRIIVDSAAIYTIFFLSTLVAYLAGSNIALPLVACTGPVIGLTFCLIIVRAGLSPKQQDDSTLEEQPQPVSSVTFGSLSAVQ